MQLSKPATIAVILAAAASPLMLAPSAARASAATTVRVSVSSSGGQANGRSTVDAISPDGRFVLFDSWASNLVNGDTNGVRDVFLRDLKLGRTTRVSVGTDGRQANGPSRGVAVSGNGRFVLFVSKATNLTNQTDRNRATDVFVRNRLRAMTFRASVTPSGGQFPRGAAAAGISDNGRWVAMGAGGPTSGPCPRFDERTYIRDRVRHMTRMVGRCRSPEALSPSGQWLVVSGDRWGLGLVDLATGRTTRVTSGFGVYGALTRDGRYMAYSELGESERVEAWRWNRITGRTRLIHQCGFTPSSGTYRCDPVGISAYGGDIAVVSDDPSLVGGDTNDATDLFGIDVRTNTVTRLDLTSAGTQIGEGVADTVWGWAGPATNAVLSSDGRWAAFTSKDGLVVPGDTNERFDVFLRGPLASSSSGG